MDDTASHYGLHNVTEHEFLQFYSIGREKTFSARNINSAFKKAGIMPLNSSLVLSEFKPQEADPKSPIQPDANHLNATDSIKAPNDHAALL